MRSGHPIAGPGPLAGAGTGGAESKIAGLEAFRRELKRVNFQWPKDRVHWRGRTLEGHLLRDSVGAVWRALAGPSADVAIVPTGWPSAWFRGRVLIQVTTEGLLVRRPTPLNTTIRAARLLATGLKLAVQIGLRGPHIMPLAPAPAFRPKANEQAVPAAPPAPAVLVNGQHAPAGGVSATLAQLA